MKSKKALFTGTGLIMMVICSAAYSYETAIRRNHLFFGIACQRISDDHKRKYSNESKIALVNIFMFVGYDRRFFVQKICK